MNHPTASLATVRMRCRTTLCVVFCLFTLLFRLILPVVAQTASGKPATRATEGNAPANVAVLVIPLGADTARVALNYQGKVRHSRVRDEIDELVRLTGGRIEGKVTIEDYSLNKENLKRFPVTTSALLTLTQAPQFQDAEPRVLPYLQAFRRWKSLDVLVQIAGGIETPEPLRFQSAAMNVWLFREPTMARYHAEIAKDTGTLPAPTFPAAVRPDANPPTNAVETQRGGTPVLPLALIAAGVALIGGAAFYLFSTRRTTAETSARTG